MLARPVFKLGSGDDPTIVSYNAVKIYNASAVKNYDATGSLVRLEAKKLLRTLEKRSSLPERCSCNLSRRTGFRFLI
jgi:hypothetical protein